MKRSPLQEILTGTLFQASLTTLSTRQWKPGECTSALLLANEEMTKKLTDNPIWISGVGFGSDTMRAGDRPDNPAWKGIYPEEEKIWPKTRPKPHYQYPN